MYLRVAAAFVGLLAATTLVFAQDSKPRKAPPAKLTASKERAAKTRLATAPAAAPHHEEAARRGKTGNDARKHKEEPGTAGVLERDPSAVPVNFPESVGWQLIEDPATGARLGLPGKLVPRVDASRTGSRWTSAQGQIQIETFRLTEAALPALFEQEKKASHREIVSSQLTADAFVISGVQGLKNFRVRAAARGTEVRGVTVLYDQATEGTMDRIAAAVVGAFTAFPDPNASPAPGIRRMVEYGTAIAVSGDGDLITTAHVTDDCQAITLPGLGHAERVAAETANDLALIHVYGAHNLVPATFAADGNGTEFKLIGVADPLAQAGAADVTSAVCLGRVKVSIRRPSRGSPERRLPTAAAPWRAWWMSNRRLSLVLARKAPCWSRSKPSGRSCKRAASPPPPHHPITRRSNYPLCASFA